MSVKAADVFGVVQEAVDETGITGPAEQLTRHTPGTYECVTATRDCLRGFLITVKEIPFDEVDRLAHPEQY